ncbi:MAG: hypothetical protein EXQ52_01500 [Bryobacterales bacterium]|nr:hypothetical protein [Bryobacterales bacterium]
MPFGTGNHIESEALEQYSMGTLPEPHMADFEEHLLICAGCQDRLEETDAYIRALRAVAPQLRNARAPLLERLIPGVMSPLRWRLPVWAGAAAMVALVAVTGTEWSRQRGTPREPVVVVLEASRGADAISPARAAAGSPLVLSFELSELPSYTSYQLEIVDSTGRKVWGSSAEARNGKLLQNVDRVPGKGNYFVRLYAPTRELLREYGLRAE